MEKLGKCAGVICNTVRCEGRKILHFLEKGVCGGYEQSLRNIGDKKKHVFFEVWYN